MKLLKDIEIQNYNNVQYILDYLNNNEIIGDEQTNDIEYFHCFWKGSLSSLHDLSLQSLIDTQPNVKIILWTPNSFELNSSLDAIKIKKKYKNVLEINEVDKLLFSNADAEYLYSQYVLLTNSNNQHSIAYASDLIRFVVLQVYGGVWFDLDILFLRNLNDIKINRYVSQWGTDMCGNAAIMRLEKSHNLLKQIKNFEQPCYPTTTFKLENNLDITILPSTMFDILWRPQDQLPNDLQFKNFDDFFNLNELNLPKKIFGYHWHNRWTKNIPPFFK